MTKEFCLSDVIKGNEDEMLGWIETEDVKEFIKRLKYVFQLKAEVIVSGSEVIEMIDKLAGEKLI